MNTEETFEGLEQFKEFLGSTPEEGKEDQGLSPASGGVVQETAEDTGNGDARESSGPADAGTTGKAARGSGRRPERKSVRGAATVTIKEQPAPPSGAMRRVEFVLQEALLRDLVLVAKASGMSTASYIRAVLEKDLAGKSVYLESLKELNKKFRL